MRVSSVGVSKLFLDPLPSKDTRDSTRERNPMCARGVGRASTPLLTCKFMDDLTLGESHMCVRSAGAPSCFGLSSKSVKQFTAG